ncbi:MAG: serine/threonine protein kinase, partial [Solirubrobacterales bacterium]|nr:serine/threonine protein kinase [Solirubrobacterales bacterium]
MTAARIRRALCLAAFVLAVPATAAAEGGPPERPDTREVMFVGNNWEGTADIIDLETFSTLARINVVPDLQQRVFEITTNPLELGYFVAISQLVGEGHHQYVDDMFSSHDGRFLYVSRPSLKDVVGIDLRTQQIVWRVPVEGYRADHMAISPDGSQLLVSASTANKVHVIDPRAGRLVGEFASGDSPHENQFSRDGKRIFHASIGLVYTPADQPVLDSTKGDRWFQVVDAETLKVTKRLDIGAILAARGFPGMSSAVRPMAISPDERYFYFQLSFLHGFVEFDLQTETPRRIASLPVSAA